MSFTKFITGTTADVSEVMDNFYHIADGDRIPRTGVFLSTSAGWDVGSSAYRWDKIYTNKLHVSGYSNINMIRISSGFSDGYLTTTTKIDINLADYFTDFMLYIKSKTLYSPDAGLYLGFNGNLTSTVQTTTCLNKGLGNLTTYTTLSLNRTETVNTGATCETMMYIRSLSKGEGDLVISGWKASNIGRYSITATVSAFECFTYGVDIGDQISVITLYTGDDPEIIDFYYELWGIK